MKTVIVGDLHGKIEMAMEVLSWGHNVVFVGDYLDSFTRNVDDQVKLLMLVLDSIEKNPDKVQGLFGNHELSYLVNGMQCSGFNGATHAHIIHLESRMLKLLKEYTWIGDYLVSHAGFSSIFLPDVVKDGIKAEGLQTMRSYLNSSLYDDNKYSIGRSRGGWSACGGPFWCDWWSEFVPVDGLMQIVGHSAYRPQRLEGVTGIVSNGSNWNIDNLDWNVEVLVIDEDGSVSIDKVW